jgi:GT2 family glycosyltransferase
MVEAVLNDLSTPGTSAEQESSAMNPAPVVSIVVISYNTREMTLDCLQSIAAETQTLHEVILLDNASKDNSAECVAAQFPDVQLIAEIENHGFAQGNNIAIQHARGKYILLLNPDTVVMDGAIDQLVAFAQARPDAGIWGGRTLYGDRSLNPTSCYSRMSLWSLASQVLGLTSLFRSNPIFNTEGYGGWRRDSERQVDIVTGCFLLIERTFWDELNGFDPAFVMYGEETDLCLRAHVLGARPRITPEATIVHYAGASEKVRSDKMVRLLRAKVLLIKRHFPAWQQSFGLALLRLWPWSRSWGAWFLRRDGAPTWAEIWTRRQEWWDGWPD